MFEFDKNKWRIFFYSTRYRNHFIFANVSRCDKDGIYHHDKHHRGSYHEQQHHNKGGYHGGEQQDNNKRYFSIDWCTSLVQWLSSVGCEFRGLGSFPSTNLRNVDFGEVNLIYSNHWLSPGSPLSRSFPFLIYTKHFKCLKPSPHCASVCV